MISQAELAVEVIVQFTCNAHRSINFKLIASEVFFYPFPKLKQFSGHQTDHSIGATVIGTEYLSFDSDCAETFIL